MKRLCSFSAVAFAAALLVGCGDSSKGKTSPGGDSNNPAKAEKAGTAPPPPPPPPLPGKQP
jgi:hypothetical protein